MQEKLKTNKTSDKIEFETRLNSTLQELAKIPINEKADEVSIPLYLHKNFLVKKLFLDRFKTAYKLTDFKNKVVLDYGCGSGLFLQSISGHIRKGIGVDLDISISETIVKPDNIDLFQIKNEKDIEKFSDIDIITSFDVLEHVKNLDCLLKIFTKTLSPSGIIIISGPTENFLYSLARKIAKIGIKGKMKGGEEHVRNIFDIKNQILSSGFKLEKDVNLIELFHVMSFKFE